MVPIVASVRRKPKEPRWLQVRLLAAPPETVVVAVEAYDGMTHHETRILFEGGALMAVRTYNEVVAALKADGYRGLKRIPLVGDVDGVEIALRANSTLASWADSRSNASQ